MPKNAVFFSIFPGIEYRPKKDKIKLGVIKTSDMKLKEEALGIVKEETLPEFKALSYIHTGSPALLSLLIKQMFIYMENNHYKHNRNIGITEIEFYRKGSLNGVTDENFMVTEINIPII